MADEEKRDRDVDLAYYQATIDLIIHAENTTWARLGTFIAASGVLVTVWTLQSGWGIDRFVPPLLGIPLSWAYRAFMVRSRRYVRGYIECGELFESLLKGRGPVLRVKHDEGLGARDLAPGFCTFSAVIFVALLLISAAKAWGR